jgi:hypothetical protein
MSVCSHASPPRRACPKRASWNATLWSVGPDSSASRLAGWILPGTSRALGRVFPLVAGEGETRNGGGPVDGEVQRGGQGLRFCAWRVDDQASFQALRAPQARLGERNSETGSSLKPPPGRASLAADWLASEIIHQPALQRQALATSGLAASAPRRRATGRREMAKIRRPARLAAGEQKHCAGQGATSRARTRTTTATADDDQQRHAPGASDRWPVPWGETRPQDPSFHAPAAP